MTANYGLSFLEGVLTFISPCMLPMLPIYLFYLAGVAGQEEDREENADSRIAAPQAANDRVAAPQAANARTADSLPDAPQPQQVHSRARTGKSGSLQPRRNGGRLFRNAAAFVAGFTLVFVSMGAAATAVGAFLNAHLALFRLLGGMLMILFGLSFAGVFRLGFLQKERRLPFQPGKLTALRSLAFGAVFAFGWTPCVGYLLSSSLLMASTSGSVPQGMAMLLLYSLGLGLPFLFSSLIYHELKETFRFLQRHNRLTGILSGIVMIAAGVLTLTGRVLTNW